MCKWINKLNNRKAFTIVELVIVIAVIAILATVLVPTFGNVINNAKDSAAKQEARNAYTEYVVDAAASGAMGQYYVYQADEGRFVAIDSGSAVGVYATRDEALQAMVGTVDADKIFDTANDKLFVYGAEPAPGENGGSGGNGEGSGTPDEPDEPSIDSFMHISFDDVKWCFKNLKEKTYNSLYAEPFFGWLKNLHDTYGAKFSLYSYYNDLNGVPSNYAAEFAAASDWLKIGLHADKDSNSTGFSTYEEGKAAWTTFVRYVKTITDTTDSIDRMPRLHYFAGKEPALQGMRDAECGALGFLTADAERASYYFTQNLSAWIYNNDHVTDHANNLVFLATDFRGDWFLRNTSNAYVYKEITKSTVYEELEYRFGSDEFKGTLSSFIFFAHEWQFYTGSQLTDNKAWTEDACKFAKDKGIPFDYPQNRTFTVTDHDIYPGEDNDPPADESETTTRDNDTVTIVDNLSDIKYVLGSFSGGRNETPVTSATNRAISRHYVLKVNGGETLKLVQGLDGITLQFAVKEFTNIPLTAANVTTSGQTYSSWLNDPTLKLQPDTRYIIIGFRNTTGDFTTEQLAQLPSCLALFHTAAGWGYEGSKDNRVYVSVDLQKGDIVNFSDDSVWGSYKYAIGWALHDWIKENGNGYRSGAYTIEEDRSYVLYVAKQDDTAITAEDLADIAAKTGYWR